MGAEVAVCSVLPVSADDNDLNTNELTKEAERAHRKKKTDKYRKKEKSNGLKKRKRHKHSRKRKPLKIKDNKSLPVPNKKKWIAATDKNNNKHHRKRANTATSTTILGILSEYKTDNNIDDSPISLSSKTPISPLSTLSGKHTNIILSYSDYTDNGFPDTVKSKKKQRSRSYTDPRFNRCDKMECIASKCGAIKRTLEMLKLYAKYTDNDRNLMMNKIMSYYNQCNSYLFEDYQHLLNYHYGEQYKYQSQYIENEINKQIEPCHIKTCKGYKREFKENETFFLDIIDLIHCFLMHSKSEK